jgi:glycosyltransferase involved in cell wall biosynthesis
MWFESTLMSQTIPLTEDGGVFLPEPAVAMDLVMDHSRPESSRTEGSAEILGRLPTTVSKLDAVVDFAIPVYNEEGVLAESIRRLRTYLDTAFPFSAVLTIVDNASTDGTWAIATHLAATCPGIRAIHLDQKGKGRAIRAAWVASRSEIVGYMDVDLSTDLDALLPLTAALLSGHSQVAIGSRLARGSSVLRGARREVVSRSYNLLLRAALQNRFTDATCGFKAIRRETAVTLLPLVEDNEWFFDTELLILAERNGHRIHEVPVDWVDDSDSRVAIRGVAHQDLKGVGRILRARVTGKEARTSNEVDRHSRHLGEATRYASVGLVSTVIYLASYLLLRHSLGIFGANALALALSTVGNTIAHARFTFGRTSGLQMRQAAVAGGTAFAAGIALTSLALGLEDFFSQTTAMSEAIALLTGIVAASFVRLVLLRAWAFRTHTRDVVERRALAAARPRAA